MLVLALQFSRSAPDGEACDALAGGGLRAAGERRVTPVVSAESPCTTSFTSLEAE